MLVNVVAGTLGIVLQTFVFVIVVLAGYRARGLSRSVVYGGIVAVYGYALVVSFFALLGVPWQVVNGLLVIAFGVSTLFRPTRKLFAGIRRIVKHIRQEWASIAIVFGALLFVIFIAAVQADTSIDGQLYHGPVLANIVQSGSLWGWAAPNQYLYYTDLTASGGVNLATFAGDARFDNALQVPHLLLLIALIVWVLGRQFRSLFVRVSLATLIVSAPVIWLQPRILYVDLAYGAAVAAVIFVVVLVREFRLLDLFVAGIAVAAVFATKPSGVLTGLILLVAIVIIVILRRGEHIKIRTTFGLLMASFGPPLVMGMSFYVRNLVQFGNPIYPIRAGFGPIELPGIVDLSIFASGERGSGFVDPGRLISYASGISSGMLGGVSKLDYDPRAGGFGYVPLLVLGLVLVLVAAQVILRLRSNGSRIPLLEHWRVQAGIVALAMAVLLVQPSTFDARYVIGPTVALLAALLLSATFAIPNAVQVVVGGLALMLAAGQIVWTERIMYPGFKTVVDVFTGPAEWQPITPAHPGDQGLQVAWLPEGPDSCVSIALQTSGGVKSSGMDEASHLGTLAYGLYGDRLCNRVMPITLNDSIDNTAAVFGADYLVLYRNDIEEWRDRFPDLATCLSVAYSIDGTSSYPQDEIVFRNMCT